MKLPRRANTFILIPLFSLLLTPPAEAAREATNTIKNFNVSNGIFSYDIWSLRSGTTAVTVGITSFFFDYNSSALVSPTLSNINPKYTGTAGIDDYDPMTVQILGGKIGVTINWTGGNGGWSTLSTSSPDGEIICTVNLTVTNPSANAGVAWDELNSGMTNAFPSGAVSSTYVGSGSGFPLPIQLSSFSAVALSGGNVRLDWVTQTEVNNYGFYVQRRLAGDTEFTEVPNSFVPGHGTTIEPHSYSYTDSSASQGLWWYRLRQVDTDGPEHYTSAVQVEVVAGVIEQAPRTFALLQNYPNPFNPETEIKFSVETRSHTTLRLYNTLGQLVASLFEGIADPGQFYRVTVGRTHALASGMYFYRLDAGGATAMRKMLLLK